MKRMNEVFELPVSYADVVCYTVNLTKDETMALHNAINNVDALADNLEEALVQIEYLHKKFGETGSGNSVLSRGQAALDNYRGAK